MKKRVKWVIWEKGEKIEAKEWKIGDFEMRIISRFGNWDLRDIEMLNSSFDPLSITILKFWPLRPILNYVIHMRVKISRLWYIGGSKLQLSLINKVIGCHICINLVYGTKSKKG